MKLSELAIILKWNLEFRFFKFLYIHVNGVFRGGFIYRLNVFTEMVQETRELGPAENRDATKMR